VNRLLTAVLVTLVPTIALGARYGDWEADATSDRTMFFAFTTNDSGAVFGEWCSVTSANCMWIVGMSASCDQDSSYPILANSDIGAQSLTINCGGKLADTALSRYQFMSYKGIEGVIRGAHRIGFAIPMKGDQFRVVRFSLAGEAAAVSRMKAAVAKAVAPPAPQTPRPSTKDTFL
jgi:hypothetical protein